MRTLKTTAAAATLVLGSAAGAQAATVFATEATIIQDGPRGTNSDRDNIENALGDSLGDFFELGYGAVVDFKFGRNFTGEGNIVEVTRSSPPPFIESVLIEGGLRGVFTEIGTVDNTGPIGGEGVTFAFSGNFDTLRLTDTSPQTRAFGGFDVDRVAVSPIPLPAAGFGLLAGLGALTLLRRRG